MYDIKHGLAAQLDKAHGVLAANSNTPFLYTIWDGGGDDTINAQDFGDASTVQGDVLDIHDLLVGYNSGVSAITGFVQISDSGVDSVVHVDRDGSGSSYDWAPIATILNVTGLTDEAMLLANGWLMV